jgi:YHS domain-containing protein
VKLLFPFLLLAAAGGVVVWANVPSGDGAPGAKARCIPCGMEVNAAWGFSIVHGGRTYHFCSRACQEEFASAPARHLALKCQVCDVPIAAAGAFPATYLGQTYELCSEAHRAEFKDDPAAHFLHRMWGIPTGLYYSSIAVVLVVSFGLFDFLGRRRARPAAPSSPGRDRLDLFRWRWVRRLACSRPFRFALQAIAAALFLLIIAAGLHGNQNPALNIAPLLTWTVWWGFLVILILFAGKAWCYVCPWDAIAGWTERLAFWRKKQEGLTFGLRWPRIVRNISIATILFVGLTWVELGFGVTMSPRVTAYIAIGMLLCALVSALLFDRKSFCRYGCLVGRVSGLYALFSSVEIRPRDRETCSGCRTKECVKGSDTAYGCPTFLYPGKLETNTYCIQCMECVQACPHENLALNWRPWGTDLAAPGKPRADEAYLALLMLSITGFHGLTMTPVWGQLVGGTLAAAGIGKMLGFSLGMASILIAPVLVYALLAETSRRQGQRRALEPIGFRDYFICYAYALLPIALFYHIAHNLEHLLMEGPKVIALLSDPFGWGWNLLGTAGWHLPPLISLDKLWLLQAALVLIGHVYSLWVAQKTSLRLFGSARAAFWSQLPMLAGMILFSIFSLWLLKQPMEMRTSSM